MTAGIYGARSKKNVLIIEKSIEGGQMAETISIENYPGFDQISGAELGQKMAAQAKNFGVKFVTDEVISADITGDVKVIHGKWAIMKENH